MKTVIMFVLLVVATLAIAQTAPPATPVSNLYAVGGSFNNAASPAVAGTGLYAHKLGDSGTYAFTVIDALPNTLKPFTVNTNFGVGIAQKIATIGKVPIYVPTSAGISYNGTNTGWAWSTGAMATIKIKNSSWYLLPNVRVVKSSVSNGTGYQPVVGIMFGWGQ